MRRLVRWTLVMLGVAALVRWLRHRGEPRSAVVAPEGLEDPAEELRRKLAESRAMEGEAEPEATPEASVDERRADVHAQGRAAVAEMTSPDES